MEKENKYYIESNLSEYGTYTYFGDFEGAEIWINFDKKSIGLKKNGLMTFRTARARDGKNNSSN